VECDAPRWDRPPQTYDATAKLAFASTEATLPLARKRNPTEVKMDKDDRRGRHFMRDAG